VDLNWTQPNTTESAPNAPAARAKAPKPPLPLNVALSYRVNDAAAVLGLSRSSVYALIAEKKLASVILAGRRLIPAEALRALLNGEAA
jgi:excisionase family DNA binding protein